MLTLLFSSYTKIGTRFDYILGLVFCLSYYGVVSENVAPSEKQIFEKKQLNNDPIIILREETEFDLTGFRKKELKRTVRLKICSQQGAEMFDSICLPESFDIAENHQFWQQGRKARPQIPRISNFDVKTFNIYLIDKTGKRKSINTTLKYFQKRWTNEEGEFLKEEVPVYFFKVKNGDIIEYSYSMFYFPHYGDDIVYFNSEFPKQLSIFRFRYAIIPDHKNYEFILSANIPDSCQERVFENDQLGVVTAIKSYSLHGLSGISHFIHAKPGFQLSYLYFNMNYTILLYNNRRYSIANLPDYSWSQSIEDNPTKWNTKFPSDVRKFFKQFSNPVNEREKDLTFLRQVTDTLNNFRFYTENDLLYNQPRLYGVYSSEFILKRRLREEHLFSIYKNLFLLLKEPFYVCNLVDNRLGEQNPLIRNRSKENICFAFPDSNRVLYLLPRYNGLKYFVNELPFYYEGTLAAILPGTYQKKEGEALGLNLKFIRTRTYDYENNSRTETTNIIVKKDSLILETLETLSGQFSTVLRPLYENDIIDSSVAIHLFHKCSDKPKSLSKKMIRVSSSETYPFTQKYALNQILRNTENGILNLDGWFSFPYDSSSIQPIPTHTYYFEFPLTDFYQFAFSFDSLTKVSYPNFPLVNISNEYFELKSEVILQKSILTIKVANKVKRGFIPLQDIDFLREYLNAISLLNKIKIVYAYLGRE